MRLHGLRCSVFGEQGDCPKLLLSGRTYSPKCSRAGYSLVGVTSCNNGELIPAACQAAACDTRTPPRSGTSGTCGPSLASGETCAPSCNDGFALSGVSRCVAGMLTAATCERVSNRCSKETAPVGCFNKGRTCQECCSNLSLSSDCWDVSAGITFSACCNSCLNQAPANGVLGGSCALVLPDRTTCVPECNPGFQLLGNTRCTSGFLSPATCEKIQICNLATSFQLSRSSNGSSSLVDSAIHARFEMAQASLVAVPYLTIVSASTSRETLMARTGQLGHLHVGSGEFVAVGMHAGVIMVDQQPCVRTILDLSLECRAGFTWNGRRCAITADQSVCAMTTISLSQRAGPRLLFDLRGRALFGSNLSFATAQPRLNSCHAVWVPVPEASLRFSARTRVRLDYIGRYTIKGQCPSQDGHTKVFHMD